MLYVPELREFYPFTTNRLPRCRLVGKKKTRPEAAILSALQIFDGSENAWEVPRTLRFWDVQFPKLMENPPWMSRCISYFPIQHGDFRLSFVSFQGFNVLLRFWDLQSPRFWFKMLVVWDLRSPKLPAKTHQNGWLEDEVSFWGPGYLSFRESTSPRVFFCRIFSRESGGKVIIIPIAYSSLVLWELMMTWYWKDDIQYTKHN